jgi:hypothetical protein
MQTNARGAILVSTQLTWSEAIIVLSLLKQLTMNDNDPELVALGEKMHKIVDTVEHQEKRGN